jgi:hypothetical protein
MPIKYCSFCKFYTFAEPELILKQFISDIPICILL